MVQVIFRTFYLFLKVFDILLVSNPAPSSPNPPTELSDEYT